MMASSVLDPICFDRSCFEAFEGYKYNICSYLDGLRINGLLLCDKDENLLTLASELLTANSTKDAQRVSIYLAEALKVLRPRKRVIKSRVSGKNEAGDLAYMVHCDTSAECTVTSPECMAILKGRGLLKAGILPMSEYIDSQFEKDRQAWATELPPIDQLDPLDGRKSRKCLEEHIKRIVRYSRVLRFYDKQIGKGNSQQFGQGNPIQNFLGGISFILDVWQSSAYFKDESSEVEIITVAPKLQQQGDVDAAIYDVKNILMKGLTEKYPWPVRLRLKSNDIAPLFHPRHLQTEYANVLFERGFDFLNKSEVGLKRAIVKIDNGSQAHLREIYDSPDYR